MMMDAHRRRLRENLDGAVARARGKGPEIANHEIAQSRVQAESDGDAIFEDE